MLRALLLVLALCFATFSQAFVVPIGKPQQQRTHSYAVVDRSHHRRTELTRMEVDPAVVGGVVAGLVGVSLGVGAMIFTEKQTLRREERRAADRMKTARAAQRSAQPVGSTGPVGSSSPAPSPPSQAPVPGQEESSDDGW